MEPWPTRRVIGRIDDIDHITDAFELAIASERTVRLDPDELPG